MDKITDKAIPDTEKTTNSLEDWSNVISEMSKKSSEQLAKSREFIGSIDNIVTLSEKSIKIFDLVMEHNNLVTKGMFTTGFVEGEFEFIKNRIIKIRETVNKLTENFSEE